MVLEQGPREKKVYAREHADMVSAFFKLHTVNKDDHILYDEGDSFR